MLQTLAILGRQPALGIAELESLYGSENIVPTGKQAALLDIDPKEVTFNRLGGTLKLAKLLTSIPSTHWPDIENYLASMIPEHLQYVPEGKFKLGLSAYDLNISASRLNAAGLKLKKIIKNSGRSVRIIPNKESELNSAQVLHNNLTGPTGWELLLVKDGDKTVLAQTVAVQDIDAYAARDQARPKRDARVGMLPPKLAQTIVNLAGSHTLSTTGKTPTPEETDQSRPVHAGRTKLLDPFCGTGVVLQEALLMGYETYGTDLEPRMIEYSQINLEWLTAPKDRWHLAVGDATSYVWKPFDIIAGETYLGRPFSALPAPDVLNQVIKDVDTIHRKFLQNVARQTKPGFKMCIAVPAWKTNSGFKHLKTLDNLTDLGYTRSVFKHARNEDLIYHREGQVVGRELVVLIRK